MKAEEKELDIIENNEKPEVKKKSSKLKILFFVIIGIVAVIILTALFFTIQTKLSIRSIDKTPAVLVNDTWESVPSTDWMALIDGETLIGKINIPGTHDTTSKYADLSFFSKTQNLTIEEQLQAGFRVFDLRLEAELENETGETLKMIHGFVDCKESNAIGAKTLMFGSVLEACYDFLLEHPTETIIVSIKQDHGNLSDEAFQKMVTNYIALNKEKWFLENRVPKLNEVRGKIVLLRRYEDALKLQNEGGININWPDQKGSKIDDTPYSVIAMNQQDVLLVQDRYDYKTENKWNAVKTSLDEVRCNDNNIFMNFTSTRGTFSFGHPIKYAKVINKAFLTEYSLNYGESYGWLIVDYSSEAIARTYFSSNIVK